jgi:putative phosphoesterase
MKFFIASDIHGSLFYCSEMIEAYRKEKADRMLLLGDLLYHGPRNELPKEYNPKEVISLLSEFKDEILCVRGNCEAEVDQMVLPFPVMAEYMLLCADDITIFATHGHKYSIESPPPLKKGDVLLCGHTHIPKCEAFGENIYINPGSVSIPKENSHHGYMIFENKEFIWKNFDGEIIKTHKICE